MVGIIEWFTVHHVVDLKRFVYSSLISSKKNWFRKNNNSSFQN